MNDGPTLLDFVGHQLSIGDCVLYPTCQGSNAARLLYGVITGFAHPKNDPTRWVIKIERPHDTWFRYDTSERRTRHIGVMPTQRIRATLLYPERIFVTGESPEAFWARYTENPIP